MHLGHHDEVTAGDAASAARGASSRRTMTVVNLRTAVDIQMRRISGMYDPAPTTVAQVRSSAFVANDNAEKTHINS
jgi:hypothetical protein